VGGFVGVGEAVLVGVDELGRLDRRLFGVGLDRGGEESEEEQGGDCEEEMTHVHGVSLSGVG
jgi:hypothetical protein